MYHFFVKPNQIDEGQIQITGSDVNHIKNVLRMKPGEEILVGNGMDCDYICKIREITGECILADILSMDTAGTELPARIYLFQGLPKGDKMEFIIQKAVELGVYQVIPVKTKRTVVKLDAKKEEARVRRWNTIAEGAAKQSKRTRVPDVTKVLSFKEAIAYGTGFDCNLIPYEQEKGMAVTKREINRIMPGMQVGIFIGPEGGFDESEIALAMENQIVPISLGRRILRTETAGLAVLSILGYLLETMD